MTTKFFKTLSGRLTLWYTLTYSISLILAFCALYAAIGWILDYRIDEDLQEDVDEFRILYQQHGIERVQAEIVREVQSSDPDDFFIQLLRRDGSVVSQSDMKLWDGFAVDKIGIESITVSDEALLWTPSIESREYAGRVIGALLDDNLILLVGESTEQKAEILQLLQIVIGVLLLIVIPAITLIGKWVTQRAVKGIEEVSRTASVIDFRALDLRVNVNGGSEEVLQLAHTFNAMLDRIRKLVTEMRELTDNVAHDLRSPLARIRAMSETALSNTSASDEQKTTAVRTIEECDRLLQMINTTLDISELEAGTTAINKQRANISDIVNDACELFEPLAEEKNIAFQYHCGSDCQLCGNVHSLQRMLANLLDNAVKYTSEGGSIAVNVDCSSPNIIITIQDSGIGIPKREQTQIFERFYRCDQSRTKQGCGLGLSFARAVVRAHGGEISVQSQTNQGSLFTISLPKS